MRSDATILTVSSAVDAAKSHFYDRFNIDDIDTKTRSGLGDILREMIGAVHTKAVILFSHDGMRKVVVSRRPCSHTNHALNIQLVISSGDLHGVVREACELIIEGKAVIRIEQG